MRSDIEIAQAAQLQPIGQIAAELGLNADEIELHGHYKAKVPLPIIAERGLRPEAKLVLVTSINPTPAGEGKTTVTVGLADALHRMGQKVAVALREPSLGPVFGIKGGATGGGYAQVVPMVDINLHFTGDIHALTAATNTIAAFIDNHLQHGNDLDIDARRIVWKRALDVNDRALRDIVIGLGGRLNSVPREDSFDVTAASELMAVLCLARSYADLKARIGAMVVAYNMAGEPVTVEDLGITGAVAALLRDALKPNLVQTLEGTPVLMHGGPFANISIGCNSVLATRAALALSDIALTEAGFGADLGGEKFLDIVVPQLGKAPDAIVIVVTLRSIKMHGGVPLSELGEENLFAVQAGFANVRQHVENMRKYGIPVVVAINKFVSDFSSELDSLTEMCADIEVPTATCEVFAKGGAGGTALGEEVLKILNLHEGGYVNLYDEDLPLKDKIARVVHEIYRGDYVKYSTRAAKQLVEFEQRSWGHLPVCIAKTQYSFSDNPKKLGAPQGFEIEVAELIPKLGAGYIVVRTGNTVTMPGLPKAPSGLKITLSDDGVIGGVS